MRQLNQFLNLFRSTGANACVDAPISLSEGLTAVQLRLIPSQLNLNQNNRGQTSLHQLNESTLNTPLILNRGKFFLLTHSEVSSTHRPGLHYGPISVSMSFRGVKNPHP